MEPTDGSDAFFQRAVMELKAKAATKLELQHYNCSSGLRPQKLSPSNSAISVTRKTRFPR